MFLKKQESLFLELGDEEGLSMCYFYQEQLLDNMDMPEEALEVQKKKASLWLQPGSSH